MTTPQELSPEDQLCLLLARGRFSPEVAKRTVHRLEAGPNWDAVLPRMQTHGLIPLIYHRLESLGFVGVPPQVQKQLKATFRNNAMRNVLMAEELASVLGKLSAAQVPAIPIKGVALAESLYGDAALRTGTDIDVLVHPKNVTESLNVIHSCGYAARCGSPPFLYRLVRHGKDFELRRNGPKMVFALELHFGLVWGGGVERRLVADIWSDALPRPFHGVPAFALSPEWEFLHLAEHAARHGLFSFKWLVDLDWLVERGAVDWQSAREKAERIGWLKVVQSSLAACEALFETPVPAPFALAAAGPVPKIRVLQTNPGPLEFPREALFNLLLLPTLWQRIQFAANRIFLPTTVDCEFLRLPSPLFFIYYILRPLRLAGTLAKWSIQAGVARVRWLLRPRR